MPMRWRPGAPAGRPREIGGARVQNRGPADSGDGVGMVRSLTPQSPRAVRRGLAAAVVVFVADQIFKAWMLYGVFGFAVPTDDTAWHPPIEITGFFNLVMVWNHGVSFGLFAADSDATRFLLVAVALGITVGMAIWMWRTSRPILGVCIGLVIGGAVGNVVDRLVYGAVADFLDVHVAGYHWPAFNIADSAIVVGVGLILLDGLVAGEARDGAGAA